MQSNVVDDGIGPTARGFAQSGVRIANERAVMTLIGLNPGVSNAELARLTGLGPQTTSRIVTDLEARELVLRGEVLRGRRGHPALPQSRRRLRHRYRNRLAPFRSPALWHGRCGAGQRPSVL